MASGPHSSTEQSLKVTSEAWIPEAGIPPSSLPSELHKMRLVSGVSGKRQFRERGEGPTPESSISALRLRDTLLQGGVFAIGHRSAGLQVWLFSRGLFSRFLGLLLHLGALAGVAAHVSWTRGPSALGDSRMKRSVHLADPRCQS